MKACFPAFLPGLRSHLKPPFNVTWRVWCRRPVAERCNSSSLTSTSLVSFSMNFSFSSSLTYTFCMLFLKSMSLKVGSSFSYHRWTNLLFSSSDKWKRDCAFYPLFVARFTIHQRTLQKHHVRDTSKQRCPPRECKGDLSPSGRTSCGPLVCGWTCSSWPSGRSPRCPRWSGTFPGTEAATCCHDTWRCAADRPTGWNTVTACPPLLPVGSSNNRTVMIFSDWMSWKSSSCYLDAAAAAVGWEDRLSRNWSCPVGLGSFGKSTGQTVMKTDDTHKHS